MIYTTVTVYRVRTYRNGNVKIKTSKVPYEFFNLPDAYKYHRDIKAAKKEAARARELVNFYGIDYCLYNNILDVENYSEY